MSRTIHGKSTKALRHLHAKPAALAVYWCYVARMNSEGVAWPSARGLEHDTGWNQETCLSGRKLLVDLEALVRIKDYVRPEWREKDAQTKARLLNLDKSQYFRPTGTITVKGRKIPLLYTGGDEPNDIDEPAPDARSGRASMPPMIDETDARPNRAELDSIPELDSKITEDISISSSSEDDDIQKILSWGVNKPLRPSKAKAFSTLEGELRVQHQRLGSAGFAAVIERCRKRGGRSWDYYLTALREEAAPGAEAGTDAPSYVRGEYAAFIES